MTANPLDFAPMPEPARAILRTVVEFNGKITMSAPTLAMLAGVTDRTVFRALKFLRRAGLVTQSGQVGRVQTIASTHDTDAILRRMCQGLGREGEPPPGQEYTPLADPDKARDDRARYCHAVGRGPKWALERGAKLARGLDPDVERNDPLPW